MRKTAAAKAVALTVAVLLPVSILLGPAQSYGEPQATYTPYSGQFTPVVVSKSTPRPTVVPRPPSEPIAETVPVAPAPTYRSRKAVAQDVRAERRVQHRVVRYSGSSVRGVATWYCNVGPPFPSICTHGYPASGAYAAAGPELRQALGHWRGRFVYVNGVRVQLIDWCACGGNHVIDVYHDTWVRIPHQSHVTITW